MSERRLSLTAERKPSLTTLSVATSSLQGPTRKPSLASVGMAAFATTGASSRHLLGSPAPSSLRSAGQPPAITPRKQRPPLVHIKATRRSFSSSAALDQQRIELFFHVPTFHELQRLRVPRTLTLVGLQALVQRDFGIPFEDQQLYWHGDLLEGDEDLGFYDIHDQSVLNIRVRKRFRPIGDIFTKIKTVHFLPLAKPDDYEIVEVVAPLPPTRILFKRLVFAISYLQRLDKLQAQRTQRRVWRQTVSFWEEPSPADAAGSSSGGAHRNSSLVVPKRHRSLSRSSEIAEDEDEACPVPPAFIMSHSGPERASYVVSMAQTHTIAQRLQLAADLRSPSDLRHIKKWLMSIKFFASASLPDTAIHEIARACVYVRFSPGDFIFRQGDVGDHFYILISGCVSLAAYGNGYFATMTPGQCFGEISLFEGNSGLRTASANVNFAAPEAELAVLSGDIYRRVINPFKKAVLHNTEKALYRVPQLRSLPDHIITHIAYASKALDAKHGRLLVRHGEELNVLVILIQGEVKVSVTAKSSRLAPAFPIVSVVCAPAVFGQEAVLTNTPSGAPWDIEALDSCRVLCLRSDTISIFLAPRQEIIRALNREHVQRSQDFNRRFAHQSAANAEKESAPAKRQSAVKITKKASYMRLLASKLFDSQRSLHESTKSTRKRRGAAAHVEFPKILLRGAAERHADQEGNNLEIVTSRHPIRAPRTFAPVPPSCADVRDEFLHHVLPYGNILCLRDQIRFCSFAAKALDEPDDRGRARALMRGLRKLPIEEVELSPIPDRDGIHFRFIPRPPTVPLTSNDLKRRDLHTR